ncbi:hypothetical protein KD050_06495 [Psychrobacillus sp. INOP01]|uniref:hypothetical protein n=1 Tax=Psychrobacillus sp. INOP01 TaxID=2829187 RepID=UPI001BA7F793|nr:hypothetical protein [Psychrobacillus sp. INOP01]QUG42893.1 hypothetical protein KD050_06495 [Psychrobacillus sp. INOP01]
MVLWGCTEKQLISEETIRIGVIGDNLEQFEYSNVIYESLKVEELLTNDELKTKYNFLMISNEHFNTVSESDYISRFESIQMPVLFVDSTKGWMPFISPITLQMPKLYNEYNDDQFKQSIVSTYERSGVFSGISVRYSADEKLSQEEFEELATYIFR